MSVSDSRTAQSTLRSRGSQRHTFGPPGVEKIRLAVTLTETALQPGNGAYFMTATDLVTDLGGAYLYPKPTLYGANRLSRSNNVRILESLIGVSIDGSGVLMPSEELLCTGKYGVIKIPILEESMNAALTIPQIAGYRFDVAADLSDPLTRKRLSRVGIKAFLRIAEKWSVKDQDARELLGGISSGSFYGLKKMQDVRALDQDTLTRISLLIGIFKALNILYSQRLADRWMTLPNTNPMFRGSTPLAYVLRLGQPGMILVRQLLDTRRGGQ